MDHAKNRIKDFWKDKFRKDFKKDLGKPSVPCNFGALIKKLMCSKNIIWTLEVLYFWHWNYSTAVL